MTVGDPRPDPLGRMDAFMDAVTQAHEAIFLEHRKVIAAGQDDQRARDLLRESADLALRRAPEIAGRARGAAQDHAIARILDPEQPAADDMLGRVIAEAELALTMLLRREQQILGELADRTTPDSER